MAQQTAVEWLKDKLKETYDKEGKLPLAYTLHLTEQAKEIEKEQMFGFTNHYHVIGEGTEKFFKEEFELWYNETYNK